MATALDTANSFIDLDVTRLYLEIPDEERRFDELLLRLINAVAQRFNTYTRRNLKRRTYASKLHDGTGEPQMFLSEWPVDPAPGFNVFADETRQFAAASKLTVWNEQGGIAENQVILDAQTGEMERVDGGIWPYGNRTVLVAPLTAGVPAADEPLFARAQLQQVAHWYHKLGADPTVANRSEFGISEGRLLMSLEWEFSPDVRRFLASERRAELFL